VTEDRIALAERTVLARARQGTLEIRPISIFMPDVWFYRMRSSFHLLEKQPIRDRTIQILRTRHLVEHFGSRA
jgi:hypothetical protein